MYLKLHHWHLVLAASFLDEFLDISIGLFMASRQYFIVVIIIIEELWVGLHDEGQEVLSESLGSVLIDIIELPCIYNLHAGHISALDYYG